MNPDEEVKIETGVPFPDMAFAHGIKGLYTPLRKAVHSLEVGQSFLFPREKQQSILAIIKRERTDFGTDFTTRVNTEREGYARIWRTK